MKLDLKELIEKLVNNCTCDLLYDGSTTGSLTLSKSVANYKKLIVVYRDNDNVLHTREVVHNGTQAFFTCFDSIRPTGTLYVKAYIGYFDGIYLTKHYNRQSAGAGAPAEGDFIYINKIYGCKSIVGWG